MLENILLVSAVVIAAFAYPIIGIFIGALGWSAWEKKVPTVASFFLFPMAHFRTTTNYKSAFITRLGYKEKEGRGRPFIPIEWGGDDAASQRRDYVYFIMMFWPFKIAWFPIAICSLIGSWILVTLYRPIGWSIGRIERKASGYADRVMSSSPAELTTGDEIAPISPRRVRVDLTEKRDRLAVEHERVEAEYRQAVKELDEFEHQQAAEKGHRAYRLHPNGN